MHILSILASPPKDFAFELYHNFNSNINQAVHTISKLDLYTEKFNPVFTPELAYGDDVVKYQNMIKNADVIAFFYPVWGFGLPAILKGFFDKIFQEGFAYEFDRGYLRGLLGKKQAVVISSSRVANWQLSFLYGNILSMTWKRGTLGSAGIRRVNFKNFDLIGGKNSNQRQILALEEVKLLAEAI